MKRVAIVTPWFGRELTGGAEQAAWQIATRLAARGHGVDVLTTCCRSFHDDWAANDLPAGMQRESGVTVYRFPVDRRNREQFDRVNGRMLALPRSAWRLGVSPVSEREARVFVHDNINSAALLEELRSRAAEFHAFIFIPYLYGPILKGLPLVADRAFLQPCLHDEVYAYLPQVERVFRLARGLMFNSDGEAVLAQRLFGPGIAARSVTVGIGVEELPGGGDARAILTSFDLAGAPFVLYLGRRDATKNTDLLVRAYARFKRERPDSALRLVLAGPGPAQDTGGTDVRDLGLVSEAEKTALLRSCRALFQPSRNESYGRAIMEAWLCGRPVAAHSRCAATALAVETASGGWLADTEDEWAALFATVDSLPAAALDGCGANGRHYALRYASWAQVIDRYEDVLRLQETTPPRSVHRPHASRAVHQLLPALVCGDAISSHALAIRNRLRALGYESEIFAGHLDPHLDGEARIAEARSIDPQAWLLYHHSIGSAVTRYAAEHAGPKCLLYHNITPPDFFTPFRPEFARLLENGRAALRGLARHFPLSAGDSAYNAGDLAAAGFRDPMVLPIAIDPSKWNISADRAVMERLQDGKANVLFVGRLAPNKRQDHLLRAFANYLTMDPEARLILVGGADPTDPYRQYLLDLVDRLALRGRVVLAGSVSDAALLAYYRTGHLFWSMSEHEGFCVPLVEAMWFDMPTLAYKSSAVPETLGSAGVMFTDKTDLAAVAALAKLLVRDEALRAKVIAAQRSRRVDFLPEATWAQLDVLLKRLAEWRDRSRPLQRPAHAASVRPRVAFVVQRCGTEVNGGAEAYCLQVARRMTRHWHVEILTTCALDYATWENHYAAGAEPIDAVTVRRFPVAHPRAVNDFNRLSERIAARRSEVALDEQERWMRAQGPWAPELLAYIERHQDEYDVFVFFGYLYATTYFALPLVERKAYLVPMAHDEWPIHMTMWDRFFARPRGFLFNTPEERRFVQHRFPTVGIDGPVVGLAIDPPPTASAERFRERSEVRDPFLLYIGRIDPSKGCDELFHDFLSFRRETGAGVKLVLLGRPLMPIRDHPDIVALGFVDEATKWDALAACDLLVVPSRYESLSMVLLEAWALGKPVLVNGACEVLVGQCRRAQGGLWYRSTAEFRHAIAHLDAATRATLGRQGRAYVRREYTWERVEASYVALTAASHTPPGPSAMPVADP